MWAELMILISFFVLAYLYIFHKKDTKKQTILAMLVAFAWVCFAGFYNYTTFDLTFNTFNLFPFMLWTCALVLFKELAEVVGNKLSGFWYWFVMADIWIVFILTVEYIGYNWMGIALGNGDVGLFGLPILHTPLFGKIWYLFGGTVYLWLTHVFEVE